VAGAFGFGHAAPDAVSFGGEGVGAAFGEHGAVPADLFGGVLALGTSAATFTVGGEEHLGIGPAARCVVLPVPIVGVVRMIRHCGMVAFGVER
jgi:hypothetical protein